MPTFAETEPLSLSDRVINALKDAFFAGELKPGDAIVERDLARQMKVGTPVVREALISLQGQGFVRRVTNTGDRMHPRAAKAFECALRAARKRAHRA